MLTVATGSILALFGPRAGGKAQSPDAGYIAEAFRLRDEAVAAGDQPYGAIVVLDGAIVGRGRSRVVADRDIARHAERVALKDAQDRQGRNSLAGAVIYSSSIPCMICQPVLARAGIARMVHGWEGSNAGAPRGEV